MTPFEIPERFLAGFAAGAVRRIGATLRDPATGRILGHLQETGRFQQLASICRPVGLLLSAGDLVSSITANVQLRHIQMTLSSLQMLSGATLAAATVGIGVNVAGFALVLKRLQDLEKSIAAVNRDVLVARALAGRVDAGLAAARRAAVESLLERGEEAWQRSDASDVWRQLDGPLDEVQRYGRALVDGGGPEPSVFHDPRFSLEEAVAAYEAVLVLAAARVQTLLLLDEHDAARHHAAEVHRWHEKAMAGLTPVDIAAARSLHMAEAEGLSEADARSRLLRVARPFKECVHEIRLQLADRPALLTTLATKGIRGREYVEELRGQNEEPVLILPA
jgi:hypothetical protein